MGDLRLTKPHSPTLARRDLLRIAGSGALAAFAASRPAGAKVRLHVLRQEPADGVHYDVVVAGGGVSGAYVAWRLLEDDPTRRVALCEMSGRIGGRLHTVTPPGAPHLRAELGGMRLLNAHEQVVRLCEHLGLTLDRFPMGDSRNLVYLRGRRWTAGQWSDPAAVPYVLQATPGGAQRLIDERGQSPSELTRAAIEWYVPDAAEYGPAEWLHFKKTATLQLGKTAWAVRDLGFWNLVQAVMSAEAYALIRDGGGYYDNPGNWNAAEAMPWLLNNHVGDIYQKVRDGYQRLPLEMAARFQAAGGDVLQPYELRTLRRSERDPRAVEAVFLRGHDRTPWRCSAGHVVLALPKRALERLDADMFLFAERQFREDLDAVMSEPAAKTFLVYPRPWWEQLGLQSGVSISDLPLRQTYYFGAESEAPGADPDNTTSLLMAAYYDGPPLSFWQGYTGGPAFANPVDDVSAELIPSAALVTETERQLAELHGPELVIPPAELALHADWSVDPFGAARHFWRIGAKSWEVMPRMRRPDSAVNVHVCGEAWSIGQGWVKGAIATAELLLQQEAGLPPPAWLPADIDLGY